MLDACRCPRCDRLLLARDHDAHTVERFEDCLRRCDACGVGYSNARRKPVLIWAHPEANVPEEVRSGLLDVLARSVNIRNRPNKRSKFGFETSEDAVTWTAFRYLQMSAALGRVGEAAGLAAGDGSPRLLLWGVEIPYVSDRESDIEERLAEFSTQLGERPNGRTEPDAIVDFGKTGVVVIEAKYRSVNSLKSTDHPGWHRYIDKGFSGCDDPVHTGFYELTRNWRFALELASGRPFGVLNLGPASLMNADVERWRACLETANGGRFEHVAWNALLEPIAARDNWMWSYWTALGKPGWRNSANS